MRTVLYCSRTRALSMSMYLSGGSVKYIYMQHIETAKELQNSWRLILLPLRHG